MGITVTVSQLNEYVASVLRENGNLKQLFVKGEISGFSKNARSGHCYFSLKDSESVVNAVMFDNFAAMLKFTPEDGMSVVVSAGAEVYKPYGKYQLRVTDMIPDGAGAQYIALEQLKKRLAEEGVFDAKYKKQIPKYPRRIGVVTSREGAALRDIIQITGRRYPAAEIVLFPTLVQGAEAPASVSAALARADKAGCDVIICGRGGGSAEDLSAFNTEEVALAIFDCKTPVISAVGHETDTTLADHAADLRAPTPSAAAELAVPQMSDMTAALESSRSALVNAFSSYIASLARRADEAREKLALLSPGNTLQTAEKALDSAEKRLRTAFPVYIGNCEERLSACDAGLHAVFPQYIALCEERLASCAARLDALSPLKILSRGYSIAFRDGKALSSAADVKTGDTLTIRLADGEITAEAKEVRRKE